jgi:hypothetical protein
VKKKVGSDFDLLARLSIVEEASTKVSLVMHGILTIHFFLTKVINPHDADDPNGKFGHSGFSYCKWGL